MDTGKTNLKDFISHIKRANDVQLKSYSANPNPLSFENSEKSWGINSDFPRQIFLKLYSQIDQKELNVTTFYQIRMVAVTRLYEEKIWSNCY